MSVVKHPEHVLAIKKEHVVNFVNSDKSVNTVDFVKFFEEANGHLIVARRTELENSKDYLQILPYVMVAKAEGVSDISDLKFLTHYRFTNDSEGKLHGNMAIGFSGNIGLNDVVCDENSVIHLQDTILTSVRRKVFEELNIEAKNLAGVVMGYRLVTDYSNSIDQTRIGIVFIVTLKNEYVINLTDFEIAYAGEFTAEEFSQKEVYSLAAMENWSKLLVEEVNSNPKLNGTCYFHFPSFGIGGDFSFPKL